MYRNIFNFGTLESLEERSLKLGRKVIGNIQNYNEPIKLSFLLFVKESKSLPQSLDYIKYIEYREF